jgi:ABC-type oligopeptide transport system substrate-binding subunit
LAVQQMRNYVVEGLLARGYDEPFTLYGLLAKTVETDDERTYVTFHLDPRARSPRPRRSIPSPSTSIWPEPMTANCR